MKKTIAIALLACFIGWAKPSLSHTRVLSTVIREIHFTLDLQADELVFEEPTSPSKGVLNATDIHLEGGDLYIPLELDRLSSGQFYQIELQLQSRDRTITPKAQDLIGLQNGEIRDAPFSRTLIWLNMHQYLSSTQSSVTLIFKASLVEQFVDCSVMPSFSGRQKLPYYLAAGAGAAMIGAGILLSNDAEDIYNNDYLTRSSQEAAAPFLDEANKKNKTGRTLSYAGAAILLGDAVLYLIRQSKYKKKKNLYDEYCKDNIGLSVVPDLGTPGLASGGLQLRFNYTF